MATRKCSSNVDGTIKSIVVSYSFELKSVNFSTISKFLRFFVSSSGATMLLCYTVTRNTCIGLCRVEVSRWKCYKCLGRFASINNGRCDHYSITWRTMNRRYVHSRSFICVRFLLVFECVCVWPRSMRAATIHGSLMPFSIGILHHTPKWAIVWRHLLKLCAVIKIILQLSACMRGYPAHTHTYVYQRTLTTLVV